MVRRAFAGLVLLVAGSCGGGEECTEIGCADQATVTVRTPDNRWPAGAYELRVAFADDAYLCSFVLPDDVPSTPGYVLTLDCEPPLEAYFWPEVKCTTQEDDDSITQSCTPIADEFYVEATTYGTPGSVSVTVVRDGETVLDETSPLSYEDTRPNGPECEPVCRQARHEYVLP